MVMRITCLPQLLAAPVRALYGRAGAASGIALGATRLGPDDVLECGEALGAIQVADLLPAVRQFGAVTGASCHPPLAAVLYRVTGRPAALDYCFPLTATLDPPGRAAFYREVERVGRHPALDLRLVGQDRRDLSDQLPADARYIVAAHLVELFFARPDLLELVLSRPCHILLYAMPGVFAQDGGVAGGCYDPAGERLQLVLARLYEGFYGEEPGVAPFVHELGHLLDCLEAGTDASERCAGLLPGLRHGDGASYTPAARAKFLAGKRLELERYRRHWRGNGGDVPPVGHPYVFGSDGEFIAGYLELFLRTPHRLATQNPALFNGFVLLLNLDPRRTRRQDFAFYVEENRRAYASGHPPLPAPRLTVPTL